MNDRLDPIQDAAASARRLPALIQGGMGVGVSHWRLAKTVSQAGGLGVVSGTALDRVIACRLQDGDPDGGLRRVLATFPIPGVAERVLARWFVPGGISPRGSYRTMAMIGLQPTVESLELLVVANFAEIALAKEGHGGVVGINLLEKIQTPNLASLYGAMLAGVDAVLMGAGIPREVPAALDRLSRHEEAGMFLRVEGALPGESFRMRFVPADLLGPVALPPLRRPPFLAVISSDTLAQALLRSTDGQVDGFVVEGPTAGGHNAPPRNHTAPLSPRGEPVYGPRDEADLARLRRLDRPFWLAGGYGTPDGMARARALGAQGVQVGTAFAFSDESGLAAAIRAQALELIRAGRAQVFTDPLASPTGFPFKVAAVPGTLSDPAVYAGRTRACNIGYLRTPYRLAEGGVGWRCGAEPEAQFIAKGGNPADLAGRFCLCNGLMASAGHPLLTPEGGLEPALVTAGDCLSGLAALVPASGGYSATALCAQA